ncbi:MAG TPA: DUF4215 domain-containing protein [Terriglobales bacterium]|nr:DUF4215 domain-containing protein [Terriglobales bacterium]
MIDEWSQGGPEGGVIYDLEIDPLTPSILFAATDGGVFKTVDGGVTWAASHRHIADGPIRDVAIAPSDSAIVYAARIAQAGGIPGGVLKSSDGGTTWSALPQAGGTASAIAIDPVMPTTVLAGGSGVRKSTDGGTSWSAPGPGMGPVLVNALLIDPDSPTTVYAATTGGMFKSTDGAGSWTAASDGMGTTQVVALKRAPGLNGALYAVSAATGVFKSDDGAQSWISVSSGLPSLLSSLVIDPVTSATLYVGSASSGLFKSTTAGASWTAANNGLLSVNGFADRRVIALAIDPSGSNVLYAGMGTARGVYKTTNAAATWSSASQGLTAMHVHTVIADPVVPATYYAGTQGGVFVSVDNGLTWAERNTGFGRLGVHSLVRDPSVSNVLYAAIQFGGVYKSLNGGLTWSPANTGITGSLDARALALDPHTPSTLYLISDGGVFKTVDGGDTWAIATTGLPGNGIFSALALGSADATTVYVGAQNDGLFKSADGAQTWLPAALAGSVNALAVDPADASLVYAGTNLDVLASSDSASSWAPAGLPAGGANAILIHRGNGQTVYVGRDGGVYRNVNASGWTALNQGLSNVHVNSLAVDPADHLVLYAATAGGLFRQLQSAIVGDGVVSGDEQCDDGNGSAGDGCSDTGQLEEGFFCSGSPSSCEPICGDALVLGIEQCDDGNTSSGDCCSETCHAEPAQSACASDGVECTTDQCDGNGACAHLLDHGFCGDGNPCTDDSCNHLLGCQNSNNDAACDDGVFCNGTETCGDGACAHSGDPCLTGGECNSTCDEDSGNCHAIAGTECATDGDGCTADQCDGAGSCSHPVVVESVSCGNCGDGIDNDQPIDGDLDSEDDNCATLAALQRFGVISAAENGKRLLSFGGDVWVAGGEGDFTVPYPLGPSRAGVCGFVMDIRAGVDIGILAVESSVSFGQGEGGERTISIREAYVSDHSNETFKTDAPLVGGSCNANPSQTCAADADCAGQCDRHSLTEPDHPHVDRSGTSDNFLRCRRALAELIALSHEVAAIAANVAGYGAADEAEIRTRAKNQVVTITVGSGLQVLELENVQLQGNSVLTLTGTPDTTLVLRVKRKLKLGGSARVELAGGLTPERVLWNVEGERGGSPTLKGEAQLAGTLLAAERKGVTLGGAVIIDGALYSRKIKIKRGGMIVHKPFVGMVAP